MYTTFGFVSAACLDFMDSTAKTVNMSTTYEVMLSDGLTSSVGKFKASKITPNPNYDPASFANNIAIVEFANTGSSFVNYIASWRDDWTNLYFVRRSLDNATQTTWNQPALTTYAVNSDVSQCASANPLFQLNEQDLLCNQLSTSSIMNASCSIPYASMYGVVDPNAAIGALYSHSAIYGQGNFCNGNKVFNYYILMQNYVHWAMGVIGQKAPVFHTRIAEYTENLDPNYSMKIPTTNVTDGIYVYGGDLYHLKDAEVVTNDKHGLSPGAIAGILLGLLALLGLLGYFIYRKIKEKQASNRVRRWWFFGRFEKEEQPEDVGPPMADPNDPHRPSTYPTQF
ncbi:hypothetical protein H4S02_008331 [Coemansia sp. RSA 2611]|nr:hypothetical protein H4S02_008331 [Coemansia sp. RSA 2611]